MSGKKSVPYHLPLYVESTSAEGLNTHTVHRKTPKNKDLPELKPDRGPLTLSHGALIGSSGMVGRLDCEGPPNLSALRGHIGGAKIIGYLN